MRWRNWRVDCLYFLLISFLSSGAGSHYGTFAGPVKTFSPVAKSKQAYASPGRNFITNPSKKGTGYGYVNVVIGKPQTYASEPFDRAKEIRKVNCPEHLLTIEKKSAMPGNYLSLKKFTRNLH